MISKNIALLLFANRCIMELQPNNAALRPKKDMTMTSNVIDMSGFKSSKAVKERLNLYRQEQAAWEELEQLQAQAKQSGCIHLSDKANQRLDEAMTLSNQIWAMGRLL